MSKTTIPTAGLADDAVDLTSKVTGTLPTANGGPGATSFTAGITMFDMLILTADATGNHEPISSNLERVDTASQSYIGSAMTQSSGIFTFPSTGIYLVTFTPVMNANSGTDYADFKIQTTTDNSSYNTMAQGFEGASTSVSYGGTILQTTVDVTDTSNVKVRFFATQSDTNNKIRGQSTYNRTMFTFMRLGDT